MLLKIVTSAIVLLALATPPLVPSASADGSQYCRNSKGHPVHGGQWCVDKGYWPRREVRHERRHERRATRSAWEVVQRDRCLSDEYRRYAANHENPRKRQRYIEDLARSGCPHPERYATYYDDQERRSYDRHDRWDDRRSDDRRDRYDAPPTYERRFPLAELFGQ